MRISALELLSIDFSSPSVDSGWISATMPPSVCTAAIEKINLGTLFP